MPGDPSSADRCWRRCGQRRWSAHTGQPLAVHRQRDRGFAAPRLGVHRAPGSSASVDQGGHRKRRRGNGQRIRGGLVMDIFAVDSTSGVCGQRFQSRGAPARNNARSIRLLRTVQSTITSRNL